jgi:xanthine dehydrogenase YagS FAD-binding subunit
LAPALIALGARARIIGPQKSQRELPLEDLYCVPRRDDQRENTLAKGEMLSHVLLPAVVGISSTYEIHHGCGTDPLVSASVALSLTDQVVRSARIVLGQVAPTPWLTDEAARTLFGRRVSEDTARYAGDVAVRAAVPLSGNAYKVQQARVAVTRAILQAAGNSRGEQLV